MYSLPFVTLLVSVDLEAVGSCLDITIDLVLVLVQNEELHSKINQEAGTVTYEGRGGERRGQRMYVHLLKER